MKQQELQKELDAANKKLSEIEDLLTKMFDSRQLSRIQARKIADSQKDLGGKSKDDMAIALGGYAPAPSYEELLKQRIEAFKRLDPLSRFIVLELLGNQSYKEAKDSIRYAISNLIAVKSTIETED